MGLYTFPNMTDGIDQTLVGVANEIPVFIPMFLLFVWFFVFFGGVSFQSLRKGYSDVPLWGTLSGIATLIISLIMTMVSGIIQVEILGIVVAVTILFGFWFFFDKNRNEI